MFVGRAALPTYTLSSAADLPPGLKPLSDQELALSALKSSETLFQVLAALLAALLLSWLGWWREAGFNRPSRWRNLHLLPFPLLVSALTFLGSVEVPGPAFLASAMFVVFVVAFGEEVLYRGIMWRALMPKGLVNTVIITSLLYGILHLGRFVSARPWSEAVYLAMLAICSGFAYATLRWRTASIWPIVLFHFALNLAGDISTPDAVPYLDPLILITSTLGFVVYGLFLLRNPRVRADGG